MPVRGLQSKLTASRKSFKNTAELKHWQGHSTVPQEASLPARQSRSQGTVSKQPAG